MQEGDIYFQYENKFFCPRCFNDTCVSGSKRYLINNGKHYRVIFNADIEEGVYALSIIEHSIVVNQVHGKKSGDKTTLDWIKTKTSEGFYVFDKRQYGVVIYFPEKMIVEESEFVYYDKPYGRYYYLAEKYSKANEKPISFLCKEEKIYGISCMSKAYERLYKVSVGCEYDKMIREDDYRKEMKKSMSTKIIEEALKTISPSDMLCYFEKRLIGQGSETKKLVYSFYEYFKSIAEGNPYAARNIMLTAPSGCGKTEVYRIIRDFCKEYDIPVPVMQFDLSLFTESGYKGKDIDIIEGEIAEKSENLGGAAICFLDEADKKCIPSYDSKGVNNNAALQSNLLTLVEGHEVKPGINTGRTMFVFMGAFQDVRNKKQARENALSELEYCMYGKEKDNRNDALYTDININEIVEYGMIEELAGRISQVVNLHRLSDKDMGVLLKEKTKELSEELGVKIELTEEALNSFFDVSYSCFGIRNQVNILRNLATDKLSEHYFDDDFDKSCCKIRINSPDNAIVCKKRKMKMEPSA